MKFLIRSEVARPAEHRRPRHREGSEPIDEARLEVLGDPDRCGRRPEDRVLDDDPRHQVLDVPVDALGDVGDVAGEDVHEEQDEHHRLDQLEHEHGRDPDDLHQVPPRDHQGVLDGHHRAQPDPRVLVDSDRAHRSLLLRFFFSDLSSPDSDILFLERHLRGVSRERQEHVVQRGPMQRDVLDRGAGVVQPTHRLEEHGRALAPDRDPDQSRLRVQRGFAGPEPSEPVGRARQVLGRDVQLQAPRRRSCP